MNKEVTLSVRSNKKVDMDTIITWSATLATRSSAFEKMTGSVTILQGQDVAKVLVNRKLNNFMEYLLQLSLFGRFSYFDCCIKFLNFFSKFQKPLRHHSCSPNASEKSKLSRMTTSSAEIAHQRTRSKFEIAEVDQGSVQNFSHGNNCLKMSHNM